MQTRWMQWMRPFWAPEGEAAAGGEGAGGVTPPPGGGGGSQEPVSLRAQMASMLDSDMRPGFEKWANTYTTDEEFARGTLNKHQQFDARVPLPKDDSKPEEIDKFYQRIGKPPSPKEYSYDFGKDEEGKPRELPDGDRARLEAFKEYAHANHYTQKQFEAGLKFLDEDNAKQETEFAATLDRAQENSIKTLKQEWGPDYEANLDAAIEGGVAFAPDEASWKEFVNLPLAGGIKVGDHPTFLKTMAKLGRASAEDQRVRTMHQSGEADNIQAEIGKIEQAAIAAGKSTASEPYYSQLRTLHKKLQPKVMSGQGANGFG